jgi:hypothetical protein
LFCILHVDSYESCVQFLVVSEHFLLDWIAHSLLTGSFFRRIPLKDKPCHRRWMKWIVHGDAILLFISSFVEIDSLCWWWSFISVRVPRVVTFFGHFLFVFWLLLMELWVPIYSLFAWIVNFLAVLYFLLFWRVKYQGFQPCFRWKFQGRLNFLILNIVSGCLFRKTSCAPVRCWSRPLACFRTVTTVLSLFVSEFGCVRGREDLSMLLPHSQHFAHAFSREKKEEMESDMISSRSSTTLCGFMGSCVFHSLRNGHALSLG